MLRNVAAACLVAAFWMMSVPVAHAQYPVIDIASLTQLITEAQTLSEQLSTARDQLTQAQAQLRSMSGGRGMDQLLGGTVRNYLPADWSGVVRSTQAPGGYPTLYADVRAALAANAVLTNAQLAALPSATTLQVQSSRQAVALLQALSHEALATTSARFASVQQLIAAIARAPDQKAILDLHARIAAEQGMLANEQTKLQQLSMSAEADRRAAELRTLESDIAGQGQFATRFRPRP